MVNSTPPINDEQSSNLLSKKPLESTKGLENKHTVRFAASTPLAPSSNNVVNPAPRKNISLKMTAKRVIQMQRVQTLMGGIKLRLIDKEEKSLERDRLLSSITWLSYHIPECVVIDLNEDIAKSLESLSPESQNGESLTKIEKNATSKLQLLPDKDKKDKASAESESKPSIKTQSSLIQDTKDTEKPETSTLQLQPPVEETKKKMKFRWKPSPRSLNVMKFLKTSFCMPYSSADDMNMDEHDAIFAKNSEPHRSILRKYESIRKPSFLLDDASQSSTVQSRSKRSLFRSSSLSYEEDNLDLEQFSRPTLQRTNRNRDVTSSKHLSLTDLSIFVEDDLRKSIQKGGGTVENLDDGLRSSIEVLLDEASERNVLKNNRRSSKIVRKESTEGLPLIKSRESALLFIDISGFTKLSTLVGVETLSSGINSYFQMITDEIDSYGGDVLKFAGDALFAEWKCTGEKYTMETCVMYAAKCGAEIVSKCADFKIYSCESGVSEGKPVSSLNVHCGIGAGKITGVHVGNHTSNREFIILGKPIDQVAEAETHASLGELVASPEVIQILSKTCKVSDKLLNDEPSMPKVIATPTQTFFRTQDQSFKTIGESKSGRFNSTMTLTSLCSHLDTQALRELRKLISLYVHPVVVDDDEEELNRPTARTLAERIQAEAELRPVFVMFITPMIDEQLNGPDEVVTNFLNEIFLVTVRELDRFKGHLRQFIVDDKGVVLIATFGLRGSNSQHMITNRALPATRAIHNALLNELDVENRIGATYGNVYCGVVGGEKRHEYAVLGPSVNLAARLMTSYQNPGVLVDEKVRLETGKQFVFNALDPVKAKGYSELVRIFEPVGLSERQWKKLDFHFIGRKEELNSILQAGKDILLHDNVPKFFLITGDALIGKSSLLAMASENIRSISTICRRPSIILRHVNNDDKVQVPLDPFRIMFVQFLDDLYIESYDILEDLPTRNTLNAGEYTDNFKILCDAVQAPPEFVSFIETNFLAFPEIYPCESSTPDWSLIVKYIARIMIYCMRQENMLVIALDDAHNMDRYSWEVIQRIFEHGCNLLILCAKTSLATSKLGLNESFWNALQSKYKLESRFIPIELKPFKSNEMKYLSAKYLGDEELDEGLFHNISDVSLGMPGMATHLMDNIKKIRKEKSTHRNSIITEELNSMSDIFTHQMDALDAGVRSILQVCAVIGFEFSLYDVVITTEQDLNNPSLKGRIDHAKTIHSRLDLAVKERILQETYEGEQDIHQIQHPYPELNRVYRFSHRSWRDSILKFMLESRKLDLQKKISSSRSKRINDD